MPANIEWVRDELLYWIEMPGWILYPVLAALVLTALWLHTKIPSAHKAKEGAIHESWLDSFNTRVLLVVSATLLLVTPLWWLIMRPQVAVPCVVGLLVVINHTVHARPIGDLEAREGQLFVGLPSLVLIDSILGVPGPIRGWATLVTAGSFITAIIMIKRELDNDKGRGDQSGGIAVTIAKILRLILRAMSVIGGIAILPWLQKSAGWISGHPSRIFAGVIVLFVSALSLPFFNVRITIPRFRKE